MVVLAVINKLEREGILEDFFGLIEAYAMFGVVILRPRLIPLELQFHRVLDSSS